MNIDSHPKWMTDIDYIFNKVLPKKFIVFSIATIFCSIGIITGSQWIILAGAYGGLMYAQKLTQGLNSGSRNNSSNSRSGGDGDISNRGVYLDDEESREEIDENRRSLVGDRQAGKPT